MAHQLGLLLATAAVVLCGWTALAIDSAAAQRQGRIDSREPVFAAENTREKATAHWYDFAGNFAGRQFMVLYVVPLERNAAPPPGLPRWPRPGEAFIAPALLAADADGALRKRYGTFAGPIGLAGLTDANEWLVYARPVDDAVVVERDRRTLITGFGRSATDSGPELTTSLYDYGPNALYQLLLWCVVIPTAVLVVVAARIGSGTRDRRLALLDALGAPRHARAWFLMGEAVPPVVAGVVLGATVAWLTANTNLTLPVVNYRVLAADLRPALVWLPVLVVAGASVAMAVAVTGGWKRAGAGGTSPRNVGGRVWRWPRVVFAVGMAGTIWAATVGYGRGGAQLGSWLDQAFLLALAVVLLTTPATIATFAGPVGRAIAVLGRRRGWLPALVGGRWLQHRWSALARMSAAVIIGLCLTTLISVNTAAPTGAAASDGRQQLGHSVVTVRGGQDAARYDQFIANVGRDRSLRIVLGDDNQLMVVGDCEAIRRLGQVRFCPTTPTDWGTVFDEVNHLGLAIASGGAAIVVEGNPPLTSTVPTDATSIGVLVFNTGGAASAESIARTAHIIFGIADVSTPMQYLIGGNDRLVRAYSWFALFFIAGILVLLTTTILGALDVFSVQARSLGQIGGMHSGSRLFLGIAAWNIGMTFALAGVGGSAIAMLLGFLFIRLRGSTVSMPWPTVLVGLCGVALLATALSLGCGLVASRVARSWHPVSD